jgi:hypothetical protein
MWLIRHARAVRLAPAFAYGLVMSDDELMTLVMTIVAADDAAVFGMLARNPALARTHFKQGATRQMARTYQIEEIGHYIYAGDTALHLAAAAYRQETARQLLALRASVHARNRCGAEPLHYAAVGVPGSRAWDPGAQAATIVCLIKAGADPNARDKGGATPLHRAVRTRCSAAVKALLEGGADPQRKTKRGSTPMLLATQNTGRGGSGSPEAKAQQEKIVRLLQEGVNRRI